MTATLPPPSTSTHARRREPRRVSVGVVVFAIVCVGFLAFSLPPYLTLDPAQSRVVPRPDYPLHYPLLWAHILFGSVALLTACLQIWPWLRRAHPRVHRWSGRAYLVLGVLPGSIVVLGVAPVSSTGPISAVGNTMLALLWLGTAVVGWRAARQRRFADHRAWMVRNVALTFSIVVNRVWIGFYLGLFAALGSELDGPTIMAAAGASVWTSWIVSLLVAEWCVLRRPRSRTAASPHHGTSHAA
ncbi:DUF2306 domain-containing protein [Actinomycetospora termitidis]|uniref:DUF2306 domain-containing protein n=1 Tax=Actinomycetospora termitidis TaxID=3053470 RepID=A0ABT7M745_9PSEU|nr:DUF2306 domain-containing protein [Actinomycetospora sp. Odt1-22]MDL5155862.1 DUF2306 domain-containing protein [Actinomycetospora sp. Odt1-22]